MDTSTSSLDWDLLVWVSSGLVLVWAFGCLVLSFVDGYYCSWCYVAG